MGSSRRAGNQHVNPLIYLFIYEIILIYLFSYILFLPTIKIGNELEEMASAGQNGYRR
jgi:hypothetical protein